MGAVPRMMGQRYEEYLYSPGGEEYKDRVIAHSGKEHSPLRGTERMTMFLINVQFVASMAAADVIALKEG